jgi:hypothetical protein
MISFDPDISELPTEDISFPREAPKWALNRAIGLLLGNKEEKFEYQRAIRLFQFQSWIFAPSMDAIRCAGLIAATKIARNIEVDEFVPIRNGLMDLSDLPDITLDRIIDLRQRNPSYWSVYNRIIARYGGLAALLEAPSPRAFDSVMAKQETKTKVVADLVDYRLRYVLHGQGAASSANINHAIFFNWWPTHMIPGTRGVTAKNKSVSPRTMITRWSEFEESAMFIYLHERHGFRLSPPKTDLEEGTFVDTILSAAKKLDQIRRMFGAYAYIADAINRATGEPPYITIPQELPRVPIPVDPFSDVEQQTIAQYDEYNLDMWQ